MNINLHNYESYFMLYVDDELSATDRVTVELFVTQNPQLAEELALFKEAVLPLTDAVTIDKNNLYKTEKDDAIAEKNLLLYLDNELTGAEKLNLEKELETNKSLQYHWAILQRTRLDAEDQITFPDKAGLYKREKGRLIAGGFVRWAAAAALLAAGFFVGISINKNQSTPVAIIAPVIEKSNTGDIEKAPDNKNMAQTPTEADEIKTGITQPVVIESDEKGHLVVKDKNTENDNYKIAAVQKAIQNEEKKNEGTALYVVKPKNDKIQIAKPAYDQPNEISVPTANKIKADNPVAINDINTTPVYNSYAKTALLNEASNDDRILFMREEDLAESKAGVFLKKIKRTITRTANIKTGNSLKIAGFEVAL